MDDRWHSAQHAWTCAKFFKMHCSLRDCIYRKQVASVPWQSGMQSRTCPNNSPDPNLRVTVALQEAGDGRQGGRARGRH